MYLEPARRFLLNPALQDSSFSCGAKFYNADDKLTSYHLSAGKSVGRFGFAVDYDYFHFAKYKKFKSSLGANFRTGRLRAGASFSHQIDDDKVSKRDAAVAMGVAAFSLEGYAICSSIQENQWAAELRYGRLLSLLIDAENFLVSTDVPLQKFCDLQISMRKNTIGAGLKLRFNGYFVQFASIYHRYVEPDYLLNLGLDF